MISLSYHNPFGAAAIFSHSSWPIGSYFVACLSLWQKHFLRDDEDQACDCLASSFLCHSWWTVILQNMSKNPLKTFHRLEKERSDKNEELCALKLEVTNANSESKNRDGIISFLEVQVCVNSLTVCYCWIKGKTHAITVFYSDMRIFLTAAFSVLKIRGLRCLMRTVLFFDTSCIKAVSKSIHFFKTDLVNFLDNRK